MRTIYLDNAASTPPAPEVIAALTRAAEELYANPAAAHGLGAAATRALDQAREQVAELLRAQPGEIVFTSGGTEANALGLLGTAKVARGRHLVASAIEHPAVLRNIERLGGRGFEVTLIRPRRDGTVAADEIVAAARPDTAAVAVMLVNNELGTIQPVMEIARGLRTAGLRAHLHVDAVQAAGLLPVDVKTLGADTVAISGHKLHGPKGTGALWVRSGIHLESLWDGGRQERGLRSGTENVPGWVALGRAAALYREHRNAAERVATLRDRLEAMVLEAIPEARPTVAGAPRAPHISSIAIPDLPAEPILHALETRGVFASAGSACASRTRGPSHVLAAVGIDDRAAVLRFSLSRLTDESVPAAVANALREAVTEVRAVAATGTRVQRR